MVSEVTKILERWTGDKLGRGWTAWGAEGGYVVCLICEDGYRMKRKIVGDSDAQIEQVNTLTEDATEYEEE